MKFAFLETEVILIDLGVQFIFEHKCIKNYLVSINDNAPHSNCTDFILNLNFTILL